MFEIVVLVRKIKVFFSLLLLLHCSVINCQNFDSPLQDFQKTVGYLIDKKTETLLIDSKEYELGLREKESGIFSPYKTEITGTCFFLTNGSPSLELFFIVTAAHVASRLTKNTELIVSNSSGAVVNLKLSDWLYGGEEFQWVFHQDADVAIGLLDPNKIDEWIVNHYVMHIPRNMLEANLNVPIREKNLIMMGFPLGLGAKKNNFAAVSCFVNAASDLIDLKRVDTQSIDKFFLLDKPSAEGFSGGPVCLAPNTVLMTKDTSEWLIVRPILEKCIGLVHGTYSDNTGGKFAAVVPSKYILDLIDNFKYTGTLKIAHGNGIPWTERRYENSRLLEVLFNNNSRGLPQPKGGFKDGNGEVFIYDENDKLVEVLEFKDGTEFASRKINQEQK